MTEKKITLKKIKRHLTFCSELENKDYGLSVKLNATMDFTNCYWKLIKNKSIIVLFSENTLVKRSLAVQISKRVLEGTDWYLIPIESYYPQEDLYKQEEFSPGKKVFALLNKAKEQTEKF